MTLHFSPDETDIVARPELKPAAQTVSLSFSTNAASGTPPGDFYRSVGKRTFDIFVGLLAAPVVVPLVLLMAALIMLDGHNPFYSQLRMGRNGKTFRMWKLRTMVHDAEARLDSHLSKNPEARTEWETLQKLKDDPRITRIGRILRKTSMDELPQFFNVLIGTMSLVGPRPIMISQCDTYLGDAYYRVAPGITGLWQVSDRNECAFSGRVAFDEKYEKSLSLWTDLTILTQTVRVVMRGTGY